MKARRVGLMSLVVLALSLLTIGQAQAAQKLRVATLVPKNSSWGKVFRTWQKAVKTKTEGELDVEVYYNGVQGMEDSMVAKMKSGQLDGALLSSAGLSTIYRDLMALQLPGMIRDWATLDRVRKSMDAELHQGFSAAGYTLLAWSDVGLVREFSKGFEPRRPEDVKGKHPLVWRSDSITPTLYATIGAVVPVPLSPGEVLPALRTGKVDYLLAPALAAEQLQWTPYIDYVSNHVTACAIGGTVLRTDKFEHLPADLKKHLIAISEKMEVAQAERVRKDDAASFHRLVKSTKLVQLTAAEKAAWDALFSEAIRRLSRGTIPAPTIAKVQKLVAGGA